MNLYVPGIILAADILTGVIIGVHVLVSLGLIATILLHAGRGGGLSDMFGGGMGGGGSMGGATLMERNLDRVTVVLAVVFALTTMLLSWRLS